MDIERVGDFTLTWGESARWDDRRQRLYLVDCGTNSLHWLDGGVPPLETMTLPWLPTGVVLTEGPELVVCGADGLAVIDPDAGSVDLLAPYPEGMLGRANDAGADGHGHLVTGTLNLAPGPGASWWFSATEGWRRLDDISNANGPVVVDGGDDGPATLVIADTPTGLLYAYDYDPAAGTIGPRRTFADHGGMGGQPDGATVDAAGGVWSCVLGPGRLARLTAAGVDRTVDVPVPFPSSVAFGGPDLDRLFVTTIAPSLDGSPVPPEAGWLLAVEGLGHRGRPEPRFRLG